MESLLGLALAFSTSLVPEGCPGTYYGALVGQQDTAGATARVCMVAHSKSLCCARPRADGTWDWRTEPLGTSPDSLRKAVFGRPEEGGPGWLITYDNDEENTLRWDGTQWAADISDTRLLSLADVVAGPQGSAWVLGTRYENGVTENFVRHFDGQSWRNELWDQGNGLSQLVATEALDGSPRIYAIGDTRLAEREAAGTWKEVPLDFVPPGDRWYASTAAARGEDELLLFGFLNSATTYRMGLWRRKAGVWREVPPPTPTAPWSLSHVQTDGSGRGFWIPQSTPDGATLALFDGVDPAQAQPLPPLDLLPADALISGFWVGKDDWWLLTYAGGRYWVMQYDGQQWADRTPLELPTRTVAQRPPFGALPFWPR